jgi:dTMP kinase
MKRPTRPRHAGLFIAVEGIEGAGRSTQVELLRSWLAGHGREVVVTTGSGGTEAGAGMRALLFDPATHLHARTEALLAAADRAEHVARVIEPALARGAVVVTDRYIDSSIACQRASRALGTDELSLITQWATQALVPDLTILLDLPAEVDLRGAAALAQGPDDTDGTTATDATAAVGGTTATDGTTAAGRAASRQAPAGVDAPGNVSEPGSVDAPGNVDAAGKVDAPGKVDALGNAYGRQVAGGAASPGSFDAEVLAFERRVRDGLRLLAQAETARYLVVDATRPREEIHGEIRARVASRLARGAAPAAV